MADFYPRPPRGGRRYHAAAAVHLGIISIHALREEGDEAAHRTRLQQEISIHALREEGDKWRVPLFLYLKGGFLSTPSARRATRRLWRRM